MYTLLVEIIPNVYRFYPLVHISWTLKYLHDELMYVTAYDTQHKSIEHIILQSNTTFIVWIQLKDNQSIITATCFGYFRKAATCRWYDCLIIF